VGSMCFSGPTDAVKQANWNYVGEGRGGYEQMDSYDFVGPGGGNFKKEVVTTHYGWKLRKVCYIPIAIAAVLLLGGVASVAVVVKHPRRWASAFNGGSGEEPHKSLLMRTPPPQPAGPHLETAAAKLPYDCVTGFHDWRNDWPPAQKEWCCAKFGRGCSGSSTRARAPWPPPTSPPISAATPTSPPSATSAKLPPQLPAVAAVASSVVAGEAAGAADEQGPAQAQGQEPQGSGNGTATLPLFDCSHGLATWMQQWPAEKKAWCCKHEFRGCETTPAPSAAVAAAGTAPAASIGGCDTPCTVDGQAASCRDRIRFSANHKFATQPAEACSLAHKLVLGECSDVCPSCTLEDMGCHTA